MKHAHLCLLLTVMNSASLYSGGTAMTYFDNLFDTISTQMQHLKEEIKTEWRHLGGKEIAKPRIQFNDDQKQFFIDISGVELEGIPAEKIEATVSYDMEEKPYNTKVNAGPYTVEIQYNNDTRYVETLIIHKGSSDSKEEKGKGLTSYMSMRRGQTVLASLDIEHIAVEVNAKEKSMHFSIPKLEEKMRSKKIAVKTTQN